MDSSKLSFAGITFMRYTAPCSNFCKFCSVGFKWFDDISIDTQERIVQRFHAWAKTKPEPVHVGAAMQYTHAYLSEEESRRMRCMGDAGENGILPLQMNGCRFMPSDELREMFSRHKRAGYDSYMFTICGTPPVHDRWVGRAGEFEALMRMARAGADTGFRREEKVFLSVDSIPVLREVLARLDALPGPHSRRVFPFMYIGNAHNLEPKRISYDTLLAVPEEAYPYMDLEYDRPGHPLALRNYASEREWCAQYAAGLLQEEEDRKYIMVRLTEENVPTLLTGDCEALYRHYCGRFASAFEQIPPLAELCKMYGDTENDRLYLRFELERKWVMRYLRTQRPDLLEDAGLSVLP